MGHAGQVSCALESDIDYGHTKTIQRSRQENPPNCLRHRGNHPDGRSDLRAFPAAARRTIGGPRHHLARRSEARAHATRGARIGDAGSRGESLDPEYQLKGAEADYANLKVQVDSDLMNQKANEAVVRSDFEQARLQHDVDEKLFKEGIGSDHIRNLSRVREEQLGIRVQLEGERTKVAADSAKARLAAQQAKIDEQKALYQLKKSQVDALHVRAGINGVLQLVPVEVGQHVTPGTNLARVADPKTLKAEIKIAETQAKDVTIGQKATIDTRNGVVNGHVSRIDPSVQNGTVTVDVTITDPLPQGARPDLSVDGTVTLENLKDVLYVGRPVHGQADSTIGIFKIIDDGSEAVRVNVKLGRSSVNTIEVVEGLKVGDKVILSDMSQWDNYDRIRLK